MARKNREEFLKRFIICDCGYHNYKEKLAINGMCLRCKKVLDPKSKLKYELKKLNGRNCKWK